MTDHGTLEIRSVGKRFDVAGQTVEALRDINLSVNTPLPKGLCFTHISASWRKLVE